MDQLAAIKVTFFQECEEQMAELESGLLAMRAGDRDPETVNAVFRAVHSVKGGAGAFSLGDLVRFAHVFETALDEMRGGRLEPDDRNLDLMLRAADMLADLVRASRDGGAVDEDRSVALCAELAALTGHDETAGSGEEEFLDLGFEPIQLDIEPFGVVEEPRSRVTFKPHRALYAKASEPFVLLRELGTVAAAEITLDATALPLLDDLDAEASYIGWTVTLASTDHEAMREIFDFVDGDCDLAIGLDTAAAPDLPEHDLLPDLAPAPAAREPADGPDIKALIAMATGAFPTVSAPAAAPAIAAAPAPVIPLVIPPAPPAPMQAQVQALAPAQAPAAAPTPPAGPPGPDMTRDGVPSGAGSPTIRVDLERVDRLIDLVGELVINQAMLAQRVMENGLARSSGIAVGLDDLELLTREIQDSVMAIRAQPVKSVFQRMPRLVRELGSITGKSVKLVVEGEGTEVDKTVIERLTDPITHMIRNAIDHGLEKPEKRLESGKPLEGTVRLTALHRSGRIVIEVADDGGGIDRKRVRQIAIEKGLVPADAVLSDEEVDNIIFMPGFSTASTVSDISGRGVGMDVVRRSIQALGGRITITSRPGLGSTFTLSLPLTLAVLDGMVVSVCGQTLVLPITAVMETLQPKPGDLREFEGNTPLLMIRDHVVPVIDVGQVLGYRTERRETAGSVAMLVEGEGGRSAALIVDTILGQRQVVIKSLEANYRRVNGVAAATILGDGRVALIVDVDAVIDAQNDAPCTFDMPLQATG